MKTPIMPTAGRKGPRARTYPRRPVGNGVFRMFWRPGCAPRATACNWLTAPGLDTVPVEGQPPVNITYLAFQTMVGIGTVLAVGVMVFWLLRWRRRDPLGHRWFLRAAVAAAVPLAVVALECGWIATEVGRQPWTV